MWPQKVGVLSVFDTKSVSYWQFMNDFPLYFTGQFV